jgi:GDP-mannose transporter
VAIVGYSLCSSTLLLANKMAIVYLPSPSAISFLQICFATVTVLAIQRYGRDHVDGFEWEKVKAYAWYIVIFVTAIYTNMKALEVSNVETVIVFRACSPIAVAMVEYQWMGRGFPSLRSCASLSVVALGAVLYCLSDSQLALDGIQSYAWVLVYFVLITIEMTYGKKLTSTVKMDSVWGPVLYCNALSVLPMFLLGSTEGQFTNKLSLLSSLPSNGLLVILFSCIVGSLIGYTGWLCRGMVSATTFTLVGVVNKFLTVLLNVFIWDKHSSPFGIACVLVCLMAGIFYEPAPRLNTEKTLETPPQTEKEIELEPLIRDEELS